MHRVITGALGLLAFLGCVRTGPERVDAPSDAVSGIIPIEWAGPNGAALVVPVYVNDTGPHSFVLDTGATLTCVDTALASELDLPNSPTMGVGVGLGGAGQMLLVKIDSLRVGGARAEELSACAIDLSAAKHIGMEFDGLLGLNFLSSFHLSIDFERSEVTLRER